MKNVQSNMVGMLPILLILSTVMAGCTTIRPVHDGGAADAMGGVFSHDRWGRVLASFVDHRGMVDYKGIQFAPNDLETYYRQVAAYSPDSHPERFPSDQHKLAYWLNAYNAAAMKAVLTRYPITSVLDVKTPGIFFFLSDKAGFFFFQRLAFGGRTTSLYYLENSVVRKRFNDPRIHFALNCASMSCPRLPRHAFTAEDLGQQLDRETRLFFSEARNFRIDHATQTIHASSIMKWYRKDFTTWYETQYSGSTAGILDYIQLYLPPEHSQALKQVADRYTLAFIPYDWGLNDQHPQESRAETAPASLKQSTSG